MENSSYARVGLTPLYQNKPRGNSFIFVDLPMIKEKMSYHNSVKEED